MKTKFDTIFLLILLVIELIAGICWYGFGLYWPCRILMGIVFFGIVGRGSYLFIKSLK